MGYLNGVVAGRQMLKVRGILGLSVTAVLFVILQVGLLSGCTFRNDKVDPEEENKRLQKLVKGEFTTLYAYVIKPKCLRCHNKPSDKNHNIDLSSYEAIVESKVFPPLVSPGSPESSSLYTSIVEGKMPKEGRTLHSYIVKMIYQWIKNGAPRFGFGDDKNDDEGDGTKGGSDPFECSDNAFECIGVPDNGICDPDDFDCDE